MPLPWLSLALTGGGMLAKKYLSPKPEMNFGITPEAYKDQLTLSDADLGTMRSQNLQNISMLNTKNVSDIKQVGAARRMPSGAITSAIAGSSQNLARGASSIEPQLKQAQMQSYGNYMNLLQPYIMAKANTEMQGEQQGGQFLSEGFGSMAKMLLLSKAGFFDEGGGGKGAGGGKSFPINYNWGNF